MKYLVVVGLLAACGEHAATGDLDADPNVRAAVTVHVVDKNDAPIEGMTVVFLDTDATQTKLVTDSSGAAQASVYPNASVTAIRADSSMQGYSLTTVQGLLPGDVTLVSAPSDVSPTQDAFTQRLIPLPSSDLVSATKSGSTATFTTRAPHGLAAGDYVVIEGANPTGYNGAWQVATATSTTFTANLGNGGLSASTRGTAAKAVRFTLSYPAAAGATGYTIFTACGISDAGASTTPQLTLPASCAGASTDIAIEARGAGQYMQQAAVPTTGTTNLTDTWHPQATIDAVLMNPTIHVSAFELDRFVPYARGVANAVTSGMAPDPAVFKLVGPLAPRAVMQIHAQCSDGGPGCLSSALGEAQQTITQTVDGTQTTYALDVGATLLPWVTASYDPATTTINMQLTGGGSIDMYEASLRYVRGQVIYTWRVFGPVAQPLTFPTLASDLPGDPTVRPTDQQSAYQVMLCETDAIDGWTAAMKNVYVALGTCEASPNPTSRPLGATTSRLSQWN